MDSKELFGEAVQQEQKPVQEQPAYEQPMYEQPVYEQPELKEHTPSSDGFTTNQVQELVEGESKKGNNKVAVVVATLLFILVIGLCVFIAVSLSKMIPSGNEKVDKEYEAQTGDPWEEILGDAYKEKDEKDTDAGEVAESETDDAQKDIHTYPNYAKDDFSGPYYEDTVDCIDETVSYKIEREFYDCVEEKNDVGIYISYIQLEGDIPGVDDINRRLKEETTYFADNYRENKEHILDVLDETGTGVYAEIKSYVTYNTENMISIAVREDIQLGYAYREVAIRSYNINLDTGTILDNTSILDFDDGFGGEFRDRSNKQNGISDGAIEPYTDDEILSMLENENTLILFYTPLGMEVGYNYNGDTYTGWITITMQDYETYLSTL